MDKNFYLKIGLSAAYEKLTELYDKNVEIVEKKSPFDKQQYKPSEKAEVIWDAMTDIDQMINSL